MGAPDYMDSLPVFGTLGVEYSDPTLCNPGSRFSAGVSTMDRSQVYYFGGAGWFNLTAPGFDRDTNDVWKMNADSGYWTWIGGSKFAESTSITTDPRNRTSNINRPS